MPLVATNNNLVGIFVCHSVTIYLSRIICKLFQRLLSLLFISRCTKRFGLSSNIKIILSKYRLQACHLSSRYQYPPNKSERAFPRAMIVARMTCLSGGAGDVTYTWARAGRIEPRRGRLEGFTLAPDDWVTCHCCWAE